jgi:hypothetical protein
MYFVSLTSKDKYNSCWQKFREATCIYLKILLNKPALNLTLLYAADALNIL